VSAGKRMPPALIAFVVATLAAGTGLLYGLSLPLSGNCDGGLCALQWVFVIGLAVVGWPILFLLVWLFARAARRRDTAKPSAD
jgi:hypothetical protein